MWFNDQKKSEDQSPEIGTIDLEAASDFLKRIIDVLKDEVPQDQQAIKDWFDGIGFPFEQFALLNLMLLDTANPAALGFIIGYLYATEIKDS